MLPCILTGIPPFIKKSFILIEVGSFFNLLLSSLKSLTREDAKVGAILPLSVNIPKNFSFNFSSDLLLLLEVSVKVFVCFSEVFSSDLVTGSNTVFSCLHESSDYTAYLVVSQPLLDFVTILTRLDLSNLLYFFTENII